ncbi:MAG TPA: prolyl oligopeptidase family serine peptidase [Caldimonas sp.]|nr:prolyl oligopeptidase family serine peptidase [Caldimonas sp.]
MLHTLRTLRTAALAAVAALLAAASFAQDNGPLPAPSKSVTDNFFGKPVEDPYRNFENKNDPAVAAWMKTQSDHAHATLEKIPGRAALLQSLIKYDSAVTERVAQVVRLPHDRWFLERRSATANQFKLFVHDGLAGSDKLLVDPEALEKSTGKPHAINWFAPSSDGKLVAYGLSKQGSEEAELNLVDARTGAAVGAPISRANFGGVDWARDGSAFVFNRLQELKPGMAETDKYQNIQVWLLKAGEPEAKARAVFGNAVKGVDIGPVESPFVSLSYDGHWAIGISANGTQRELAVFVSPQAALLAGRPAWKRIIGSGDDVTGLAYHGDVLYMVSHKGAPRSEVLALDLKKPVVASARVVVPASERVVVNIAAAADALYVETRDGNIKGLYKQPYGGGAASKVKLPIEGSFTLVDDEGGGTATDPRLPGAVIDLQGWTRAAQIYAVAADGKVANTGLQPQGPYDAPNDIVTTEVKVKAADGALVPMSIIHRKGVALDGNNPTLLYGYASYGVTEEPFFSSGRLAWLDAGGVFAVANPRGSSVYGEEWYRGGFQATKPNTWNDFIACAEYLIAQKYTRPARLGILGGSAGGILVGRAMTTRPDLFAAVIDAVGANDLLRFESTPNGVPNVPEFGSVKTEAGFKALLAMSTYAHIKPGIAYPAVLFTHGVNDPRVEVWNTTKTAARLMAATTSGKPVLMRLDYDAGHGIDNTKKQQLEERADMFAFLFWQMGVPGYQP